MLEYLLAFYHEAFHFIPNLKKTEIYSRSLKKRLYYKTIYYISFFKLYRHFLEQMTK